MLQTVFLKTIYKHRIHVYQNIFIQVVAEGSATTWDGCSRYKMATVDIENMDFDVEISEESDLLEIVLTEKDVNTEEYKILDRIPDTTFVEEDYVFLAIHEQHDVELTFAKDPVQTTIHKLPPKSSVERVVFICKKMYKKLSVKSNISKTCWYLLRLFTTCQKK